MNQFAHMGNTMDVPVSASLRIALDGKPHTVATGTTLAHLISALGHAPNAVSSAVNGQFVARSQREGYALQPDDAILLFQPIVGG